MTEEREHDVKVYSKKLVVPNELLGHSDKFDELCRQTYPGIQIRYCGLQCGEFPHPKRIPYIQIALDGCGYIVGADYYYLK